MTVGGGSWRSAGAGYESEGRRFESCRARPSNSSICRSFSCSSAFSAANLSASDRNVTGVGPPVGPFETPKSGSPRVSAACSKKSPRNFGTRVRRGKTEGRAGSPGHQPGYAPGGRDPREGRASRGGTLQRQGGHGRQAGSGLLEDKRVGVQEDGTEAAATRRHGAALHLPAERAPGMAHGAIVTAQTGGGCRAWFRTRTN